MSASACVPASQGDAFIACTGCIAGGATTHHENAVALARMAVEMQRLCATLAAPDGSAVIMRVVRVNQAAIAL